MPLALKNKPCPASAQRRMDTDKNIDQLLEPGVIETVHHTPADTVTSTVLSQYQGGKARMWRDFRSLNDHCVSEVYPMPRIQMPLEHLSGADTITIMDAMKGSNQRRVTGPSVKSLIIITHRGLHQYLFIPFWTKNWLFLFPKIH